MSIFSPESTDLDDTAIRQALTDAKTIAIIGWSDKEDRPSNEIATYLHKQGYDLALVNPRLAGKPGPYGEQVYGHMTEIPRRVDIVDMFRNASLVPGHTREAIDIDAGMIWVQSGIVSEEARAMASAADIPYVQNNCIMVAHRFLLRNPR